MELQPDEDNLLSFLTASPFLGLILMYATLEELSNRASVLL